MLESLIAKGTKLPDFEKDYSNLTAQNIIEKINSFYVRWEKNPDDLAESSFLQLLKAYPCSMCQYNMTDTLELVISLFYYGSKPSPKEKEPIWLGYSFDDLSLLFDRSKSSIHEAVSHKEREALEILAEANLRVKAKEIALQQLVEEEKERIKQKNNQKANAPSQPYGEGIIEH